jgi:ParB-like chromosome segregation protein Spo0J
VSDETNDMNATALVHMADDNTAIATDRNSPIESIEHVADSATPGEGTEPIWSPKKLTVHPFAQEYRTMTAVELAEMANDIIKNGLKHRIVLYQGSILDGRHRWRACIEHGIPLKPDDFIEFSGDDKDAKAFVDSSNLYRRHLTAAERHKKIAQLLKADDQQSNRAIARAVGGGTHHETVGAARAELERRREIRHVEKRKDSKGRSYAADRGSTSSSASTAKPGLGSGSLPREAREAKAFLALASVLREGDRNRNLNKLCDMLDEEEWIDELPKVQREVLARRILTRLKISADDLPIVSVPVFESSLH